MYKDNRLISKDELISQMIKGKMVQDIKKRSLRCHNVNQMGKRAQWDDAAMLR